MADRVIINNKDCAHGGDFVRFRSVIILMQGKKNFGKYANLGCQCPTRPVRIEKRRVCFLQKL
jgi:hypothetical protein